MCILFWVTFGLFWALPCSLVEIFSKVSWFLNTTLGWLGPSILLYHTFYNMFSIFQLFYPELTPKDIIYFFITMHGLALKWSPMIEWYISCVWTHEYWRLALKWSPMTEGYISCVMLFGTHEYWRACMAFIFGYCMAIFGTFRIRYFFFFVCDLS